MEQLRMHCMDAVDAPSVEKSDDKQSTSQTPAEKEKKKNEHIHG